MFDILQSAPYGTVVNNVAYINDDAADDLRIDGVFYFRTPAALGERHDLFDEIGVRFSGKDHPRRFIAMRIHINLCSTAQGCLRSIFYRPRA